MARREGIAIAFTAWEIPALLVTLLFLVLVYRRSYRGAAFVNPPVTGGRPGPVAEIVDAISDAAYAHAGAVTNTGRVPPRQEAVATEGRVRGLILHRLAKHTGMAPAAIAGHAARGTLQGMDPDVAGFLAGEPAEARWRRRALERYRGSRFFFPMWYQFTFKRALPPADAYLRDLAIIMRKVEQATTANGASPTGGAPVEPGGSDASQESPGEPDADDASPVSPLNVTGAGPAAGGPDPTGSTPHDPRQ